MEPNALFARTGRVEALVSALALAAVVAVAPASAAGQTKAPQGNRSAQENCHVRPEQKPSEGKTDDKTGSITKKLDKCGGVLQPPDVNDRGLVKPAPDTGEMPVIKPGQVPEQAPKAK